MLHLFIIISYYVSNVNRILSSKASKINHEEIKPNNV